jgi:hypothetical protein
MRRKSVSSRSRRLPIDPREREIELFASITINPPAYERVISRARNSRRSTSSTIIRDDNPRSDVVPDFEQGARFSPCTSTCVHDYRSRFCAKGKPRYFSLVFKSSWFFSPLGRWGIRPGRRQESQARPVKRTANRVGLTIDADKTFRLAPACQDGFTRAH